MFKGLKSKLEDQGKKLQASVAQYGEQLSEQIGSIRGAASDGGSDAGSNITRRFLNVVGGSSSNQNPSLEDSLNHSVGSALMEEVTEADLLGLDIPKRERRYSGGSTHSNESSFSNFFQSVPGMAASTLDDIESDKESTIDEHGSAVVRSASKEQISSVLSKLQGRAANYKDKYRDLVKKYNDVVTENNKCRTVLAQTQDKALERMEKMRNEKKILNEKIKQLEHSESPSKLQKYETLLEKMKAEIIKNKEKIKELAAENENLRSWNDTTDGETGMSDLAAERISSEWKQKMDKVNEEWTERLNSVESNFIDQVAAAKKETFIMMESKDKEIESLRSKCRELEIQDGQANERWQKKVDELQAVVKALETEKTDMVEKLSAAKAQGVQAVRDEEQAKQKALEEEWKEQNQEVEDRHQEAIRRLESELLSLKISREEETSSASTSKATEQNLEIQLAELEEKLQVSEATLAQKTAEIDAIVENLNTKHRDELADLIKEHEELLALNKQQSEVERANLSGMITFLEKDLDDLKTAAAKGRKDSEDQQQSIIDDLHAKETNYRLELDKLQKELVMLEKRHKEELDRLVEEQQKQSKVLENELENLRDELERSNLSAEEMTEKNNHSLKESEEQLVEMRTILQERNEALHRMEQEKNELEVELAQSRELSSIHEHLRTELDDARKQKEAAEVKLFEWEKRENSEELIKLETVQTTQMAASTEIDELKSQIAELEGQLESVNWEKSGLEDEMRDVKTKEEELIKKHREEEATLRDKLTQIETEKEQISQKHQEEESALREKLSQIESEKEQISHKLMNLAQSTEAQKEQTASIGEETKRLAEEKTHLVEEINYKNQLLEETEKARKEAASEMERKTNSAQEKQKILEESIVSLKDKNATLETSLASLQQQVDIRLKENEELQSRVADTSQIEAAILAEKTKVDRLETEYEQKLSQSAQALQEQSELVKKFQKEAEILKGKLLEAGNSEKKTNEIRNLEDLNERMRVEFIAKAVAEQNDDFQEKIVAELREQLDEARRLANEDEKKQEGIVKILEGELKKATQEIESATGTIDSLRQALSQTDDARKGDEEKRDLERKDADKIREQYSIALENLKTELAESEKKISGMEKIEKEKETLVKKLEKAGDELQAKEEEFQKAKETLESSWQTKLEKSIQRQKKASEDEASSAKAELMVKIDSLHADISAKERKLDDIAIEKTRLEQEVIALTSVRSDLEQKKEKEKQLTTKLNNIEHRMMEIEAENKVLAERKTELDGRLTMLSAELEETKKVLGEKENEVKSLKEVNEDSMRKVAAKQDSDSKKVIRELQREVKQLYVELNEKTESMDSLKKQLDDAKIQSSEIAVKQKTTPVQVENQKNYMYEEELEAMRRKLEGSYKEIDDLKAANSKLERTLESSKLQKAPSPPKTNGTSASNYEPSFADSAEAEYLKNVLYNYMADRETLGKECITLARVIGTVAKFNKSQLDNVLAKEESRLTGWVGGTVSQVSNVFSGIKQ